VLSAVARLLAAGEIKKLKARYFRLALTRIKREISPA
jgi:hypothetical protein